MKLQSKKSSTQLPISKPNPPTAEAIQRAQFVDKTFGKDTDWQNWSQEMQDYCVQDVNVTTKLCDHFQPYLTGSR